MFAPPFSIYNKSCNHLRCSLYAIFLFIRRIILALNDVLQDRASYETFTAYNIQIASSKP